VKDNYDKKTDLDYLKSVQAHFSVQVFANEETLAVLDWKPEQGCFALLKKLQTCKVINKWKWMLNFIIFR
jgi:hypothetical protein